MDQELPDAVAHAPGRRFVFTQNSLPTRQTRRADHTSFVPISTRTDVYKYSFFPRTLLDWNTLSAEVRLK